MWDTWVLRRQWVGSCNWTWDAEFPKDVGAVAWSFLEVRACVYDGMSYPLDE